MIAKARPAHLPACAALAVLLLLSCGQALAAEPPLGTVRGLVVLAQFPGLPHEQTRELVRQPDSRPSVSYALTRYITDVVPKAMLSVVLVAVP